MKEDTRLALQGMADAIDTQAPSTGGHSLRVAEVCSVILSLLGIPDQEAILIWTAARIHDIGKLFLPDAILHKEGQLTAEEFAVMQKHPELGAEMLVGWYPDFRRGAALVRHHHERWDGGGYPQRLHGVDIPLGARVIAVADAFDAMTSERTYRQAMTVMQAAQVLREGRGRQWDALVVDALLRALPDIVGSHLRGLAGGHGPSVPLQAE